MKIQFALNSLFTSLMNTISPSLNSGCFSISNVVRFRLPPNFCSMLAMKSLDSFSDAKV